MYRSRPWGWYPQKPRKQEQNRRKPTQTSTHLGHGEPSRYTSGCHTCGSGRRGPRRRRPRRYRPPWCRGADGGAHEDLRGVASTCWSVSSIAEKLTVVCKVAGLAVFLHACKLVVSHHQRSQCGQTARRNAQTFFRTSFGSLLPAFCQSKIHLPGVESLLALLAGSRPAPHC